MKIIRIDDETNETIGEDKYVEGIITHIETFQGVKKIWVKKK